MHSELSSHVASQLTFRSMPDAKNSMVMQDRLDSMNIRYCTLVLVLCSIDVLGPFATDATLPSLPDMASDLHTSEAWVQMTILLYSVIMSFATLLGGVVSDKFGRRIATLVGLFVFIVGM